MDTNKKKRKPYSFFEIAVIIILLAILAAFLYGVFKGCKEFLDFKELEIIEHIYE